jgi:hypothetical protein
MKRTERRAVAKPVRIRAGERATASSGEWRT